MLYPGLQVPELFKAKTWQKDKKLPMRLWVALRDHITEHAEEFNWQHVHKAAEDFHLPVEQVSRTQQTYVHVTACRSSRVVAGKESSASFQTMQSVTRRNISTIEINSQNLCETEQTWKLRGPWAKQA